MARNKNPNLYLRGKKFSAGKKSRLHPQDAADLARTPLPMVGIGALPRDTEGVEYVSQIVSAEDAGVFWAGQAEPHQTDTSRQEL